MNTVDFKIEEDIDAVVPALNGQAITDLDLFSDELEDRFNAGIGSSASSVGTAGSCFSTASSICSAR